MHAGIICLLGKNTINKMKIQFISQYKKKENRKKMDAFPASIDRFQD
jgi:hypothetical protein